MNKSLNYKYDTIDKGGDCMFYQGSHYLIYSKDSLESFIKEGENFYKLLNYIKLKFAAFVKSFLNLYTHFPQMIDLFSFIVQKTQK